MRHARPACPAGTNTRHPPRFHRGLGGTPTDDTWNNQGWMFIPQNPELLVLSEAANAEVSAQVLDDRKVGIARVYWGGGVAQRRLGESSQLGDFLECGASLHRGLYGGIRPLGGYSRATGLRPARRSEGAGFGQCGGTEAGPVENHRSNQRWFGAIGLARGRECADGYFGSPLWLYQRLCPFCLVAGGLEA